MKTMIAIPCAELAPIQFLSSMLGLRRVGETHINFKSGSLVYDNRNLLAIDAITNEADRILWIDSDMKFDPDMMQTLSADMDEHPEIDMICGIFFRRKIPTEPVIYSELSPPDIDADYKVTPHITIMKDYPRDSLFEVQGCGFGTVLMKTSVVKHVWDKFGPAFTPSAWGGEDISFCWKARQLGFRIFCDSRVKIGHLGQAEYNETSYISQTGGEKHGE